VQQEPSKIRLKLSPQAERYARRDAPRESRLMAARGALPLPALELATVLFALIHDPDAEVKSTARESLEGLPESVLAPVLSGPAHPALLSHLAHAFREQEARLEREAEVRRSAILDEQQKLATAARERAEREMIVVAVSAVNACTY